MKTKPTNWDTGKNNSNHGYVTTLFCTLPDGTTATYGMTDLMSFTGSWSLYADTYDIGNTVMNQVEFTIDIARKEGIAPQTIKRIMRWSTTRMLDRYTHPSQDDALRAINTLKRAK